MATVQEKTGCLADIPVRKQSSCGPWSPKTTGGERHQPKHSTDRNLVGDSIQSSQRSAMKGLLKHLHTQCRMRHYKPQWKGIKKIYTFGVKPMAKKNGQRQ